MEIANSKILIELFVIVHDQLSVYLSYKLKYYANYDNHSSSTDKHWDRSARCAGCQLLYNNRGYCYECYEHSAK